MRVGRDVFFLHAVTFHPTASPECNLTILFDAELFLVTEWLEMRKEPLTSREAKREEGAPSGAASIQPAAPSNLQFVLLARYSVLRLRSQLTTPTPMLPNRMAPGAGITLNSTECAESPAYARVCEPWPTGTSLVTSKATK